MSGTRNEFDEPGANYPDSAKDADLEQRGDAGVGGAVAHEPDAHEDDEARAAAGAPGEATQDGPALAQNAATDMQRLGGVVQQVRADVGGESLEIVEKSLRRRLSDVGITVADDEVTALARDIAGS
ncbi:hypothetical protein [Microbacterium sp. T2.11-28]|uniref:hypothetical protein n=1 Tax=unclassified Microbacterium TaxID=2609290 RepID=UPI0024773466|nr:hypothetical protein [Microbacterium sp. T2.11-28]CAI9388331.1 hypothetical protein MICABA_03025 [Microbacterium sp. T2.11-28]